MSCRFPGDATSPEKLWELVSEGRSAWSEIPKSRFNQEAFFHPQDSNLGTSNVRGGHFLTEDVSLFDASFFNFSAEVAASMDPQYRLQLESTFEAMESAGVTIADMAGTQTSVFAGAFFRDYHDVLMRDPETLPRYFMTGNGAAMVSNRLSHFFDLRGASATIDTGCSTGLTALHLACQSLQTGEAAMSVVGGVNVMINPDMFVSMSNLGLLGPDGRSYTFDHRGKGYGRGEGVATLLIKPLEDALRDGNPIRAVIRTTALNQDGKTPTMTSPSPEAQQELIRTCYLNAGLDPLETAYVEAHGTGTRTGDPIEAGAIGEVLGKGRPADKPLLIGSIKSNIGHLEAASGLAAIIKVALAFEKGYIPPNHDFQVGNPGILFNEWRLRVPVKLEPWPAGLPRRASISNFGYGGTNAHVIMEDPKCYLSRKDTEETSNGSSSSLQRFVFPVSARDETAAKTAICNLKEFLQSKTEGEEVKLDNLAYTLGQKRALFPWRAATQASTVAELIDNLGDSGLPPTLAKDLPRLGFVFNGQGAQWFAMGRELMGAYPVFEQTIREAELQLYSLGCEWSLIDELKRDEASSRVNETQLAMPLSVAIQIALVRLLGSWGVKPTAVTGHSSGEISAAFAAGALSLRAAMATAFFRGSITDKYLVQDKTTSGSMMAVGLGPQSVEPYLDQVTEGKVVIACVNSPSSVTLSGDTTGITELEARLKDEGVFARKLQVPAAYHSHHMARLAAKYQAALEPHVLPSASFDGVLFSSPVTGGWVEKPEELGPAHWVKNMVQPVLFADSFYNMCVGDTNTEEHEADKSKNIDMIVEIGPHGALAGPIRQSLTTVEALKGKGLGYVSCLNRGTDAVQTMQDLVVNLLGKGYPVDLGKVNFPLPTEGLEVVAQLPSYPWNHSTKFWMESRKNRDYRHRKHAPHDLLGTLIPGSNLLSPTWRNMIRPAEIPWVRDHIVDNEIVYPGAGQIAMAIEAVRQLFVDKDVPIVGYTLRDIEIMRALIIPDTIFGAEVHLNLTVPDDRSLSRDWREFHIYTYSGTSGADEAGDWVECCKGLISVVTPTPNGHTSDWRRVYPETKAINFDTKSGAYSRAIEVSDFYDGLYAINIKHGEAFQNLDAIRSGNAQSVTAFHVADTAAIMPSGVQSSHVIHPITLDQLFQAAYTAVSPHVQATMGAAIPRSIKKMFVASDISSQAGHEFHNFAKIHYASAQGFDVSMALANKDERGGAPPVLEIGQMHYQSLGNVAAKDDSDQTKLCLKSNWVHDLSVVKRDTYKKSVKGLMSPRETTLVEDLKRATVYIINDVLEELTEEDIEKLDWHYKIFLDWLQYQQELASTDQIAPMSSKWSQATEGAKQRLWDQVSAASVNGEMLVRIGNNLLGILRKEVTPLELMMEENLLYKYYENALRVERSLEQVQKLVKTFSYAYPRAKVLEIGGGTGACTGPALRAMSDDESGANPHFARYDFTDISSGFFETARKTFAAWEHLMTFNKLNVEDSAEEQGFELGSYDLIIACQVLHATRDMDHTMANVHKLLKPGGKLVMVETTQDAMDVQLVFGTLPGWWLSKEPERKYSPNMPLDMWKGVLSRTGFSGVDIAIRDSEDDRNYAMSVIMSTALPDHPSDYAQQVVLAYAPHVSPPPESWLSGLQRSIEGGTGAHVSMESLDKLNPAGQVVVFVSEIESPVLDGIYGAGFASIQRLLTEAKGVFWITRGATIDCPNPDLALHTGLLRTRRLEDNSKRYIALDLDPQDADAVWSDSSIETISEVFARTFDYATEKNTLDFEYAVRGGDLLVPRISEDSKENNETRADDTTNMEPEMQEFLQPGRELRMGVETPGLLDSLMFKDDPEAGKPLEEDFVEIEAKAFGLNFRDIMVSMGQLQEKIVGFECSGIVTRVGPPSANNAQQQHSFKVGDRVCALTTRGHWANRIRIHYTGVGTIPDHMSFEAAASIPMVFVTAYYSLFEKARLERGDTVLIHAASGGVGQAAIILAKWAGAEVFATVGAPEKRAFVRDTYGIPDDHIFSSRDVSFAADVLATTGGRGVDVLLNSLAGEMLQESWNVMATLGRFVEIGKRDIQTRKRLEMEPFGRAISFMAVDLIQLGNFQGKTMHRVMGECLDLLEAKTIQPIQPVTVYPISEIQRAFRTMQAGKHLGKIVVKPNPGDLVKVLSQRQAVKLNPEASYLLVGGLGGIGRSIAQWLVARGAKNLILVSRSAASQSNSQAFVKELQAAGCNTVIKNCDIADASDLRRVIDECYAEVPAVKGVIQAAMVLNDSVFEHMEYKQWVNATRPKVLGTRNLHDQFGDSLDFFVMLSSATGVLGNTSQANYAAGGTFQDAFARFRTSQGLPAVSIDLGMVKSVGYVAETKGVAERLAKIGYRPLEEDEVLRIIESAVRTPLRQQQAEAGRHSQVITGLAQYESVDDIVWREELRFSGLRRLRGSHANADGEAAGKRKSGDNSFGTVLSKAESMTEAVGHVAGAIVAKLSEMFMYAASDIDTNQGLGKYGVDSLVAVELRNWLVSRMQTEVSIFDILQSSSLMVLAEKAAAASKYVIKAGLVAAV
ncbi:putative polyketide synthase [Sodiomyces alkalinus F11]|uniref:Putative polyketide synthase n=1 Tax=Sodiomyces alkalinus (strain CBS 110278 / VKM F-3762 / F11) TaxID=1314773 RepID=A0A3N2Q303_SODAK|nr:putative polyketide synthase [Sodiomyces alkalinus F11]ROT41106.1 putative polyketide synthase [Sodiomyces alkalinus F11]